MTLLILLLTFVSVTLLVVILFPRTLLRERSEEKDEGAGFVYQIKPVLVSMAKVNASLELKGFKTKTEHVMASAGDPFGEKLTADEFLALSELSAAAVVALGFLFDFSLSSFIVWGLVGFALPYFWVRDASNKRKLSIQRQLPDFLDQLTLTVEAGLDFNAALAKILKLSRRSALTDEFRLMMHEIKLGATRHQALKALAARIDIADFSAFVSSLIQTDRLGSSLGPTLRIQSDQMRIKRIQLAEKAGGEATVKLLIPLVLFILPAVFIMIFGPILIKYLTQQ